MLAETRTTDAKARLVLPKSFANSTVIVEQVSETEIRVRRATAVSENDLPYAGESSTPLSDRDRDRFCSLGKPAGPDCGSEEGGGSPQGQPPGLVVMDWVVEPFGKHHVRNGFACGKPALRSTNGSSHGRESVSEPDERR